jgi:hypothetical protein
MPKLEKNIIAEKLTLNLKKLGVPKLKKKW